MLVQVLCTLLDPVSLMPLTVLLQVKNLRSKAEQLFVQVERAVARYMRNVQVLKPYSKKPHVTAITKVLLFTPIILVVLPLLASLTGEL